MTKRELVTLARQFRRGILDGGSSKSMCFAVCWPLSGLLEAAGVQTELVEGDFGFVNHFWLKLPNGDILDPTADQFGLAPIYVGQLPDVYAAMMRNKFERLPSSAGTR